MCDCAVLDACLEMFVAANGGHCFDEEQGDHDGRDAEDEEGNCRPVGSGQLGMQQALGMQRT